MRLRGGLQLAFTYKLLLMAAGVVSLPWKHEAARFTLDNEKRFVTVVYNATNAARHAFKLASVVLASGAYSRVCPLRQYIEAPYVTFADTQIFLFDVETDDIGAFLNAIQATTQFQSSIVVAVNDDPLRKLGESALRRHLEQWRRNALFYAFLADRWTEVISARSGFRIMEVKFVEGGGRTVEDGDRDLQGLGFRSTSMPWAHYYRLGDCSGDGTSCASHSGYLHDYMQLLSRRDRETLLQNWGLNLHVDSES